VRTRHRSYHRTCLGLLGLSREYGEMRLEAASALAMRLSSPTRRSVKSILQSGRDLPRAQSTDRDARHRRVAASIPESAHHRHDRLWQDLARLRTRTAVLSTKRFGPVLASASADRGAAGCAHGDGSYIKFLKSTAKSSLIVLDDRIDQSNDFDRQS
jgi:hypothetical protein